jgi:type IV pilus biogenesis protein CpaD/CtpE
MALAAKIVTFPKQAAIGEVDSRIRRYLSEASADAALTEAVAARMKIFIDRYACKTFRPVFDLVVPAGMTKEETQALVRSIENGVDAAAEQVEKMICEIIVERLFLEVEIYRHRQLAFPNKKKL